MKNILTLSLGITNTYLIIGEKNILVDTGPNKKLRKLEKELLKHKFTIKDIHYIFLTHAHWDHMGSLADIQKASGAKVIANKFEAEKAEIGRLDKPTGYKFWGKLLQGLMVSTAPFYKIKGCKIDIITEQDAFSLKEFGIEGSILFTPGHTEGSSSLLFDSGEAFVGDLAMSGFPKLKGIGMPVICKSPDQVKESWKLLLKENVKTIYPAHGVPFSSELLEKEFNKT